MNKHLLLYVKFNPTDSYSRTFTRLIVLENESDEVREHVLYGVKRTLEAMKGFENKEFEVGLYENYEEIFDGDACVAYKPIGESLV